MLRKTFFAGVGILAAIVLLIGTSGNTDAFFDDPYIPNCHAGYCGGGDFYLGFGCCGCRNRRVGPIHNRYYAAQGANGYNSNMSYAKSTNQTSSRPQPNITQTSNTR